MRLAVTLTSDFICPWCFIGERRLAKAIKRLPADVQVDVSYRPFELNPDMPKEGYDRKEYRSLKFGSWARSQAMDEHVVEVGRGEGLAFNWLIDKLQALQKLGVNHVLFNLRYSQRPAAEVVEELAAEVLPHFPLTWS